VLVAHGCVWGVCELQHTTAQPGVTWLPAFLLGFRGCAASYQRGARDVLLEQAAPSSSSAFTTVVSPLRRFVQGAVAELAHLSHLHVRAQLDQHSHRVQRSELCRRRTEGARRRCSQPPRRLGLLR
jgi:hypothetical protein